MTGLEGAERMGCERGAVLVVESGAIAPYAVSPLFAAAYGGWWCRGGVGGLRAVVCVEAACGVHLIDHELGLLVGVGFRAEAAGVHLGG